jgi:hypothetical protein
MGRTEELTAEERERAERNVNILHEWVAENEKIFEAFLETEYFSYPETIGGLIRFYKGGIVRCTVCGQEYKWRDWAYKAQASGRMANHLRRKHQERINEIASEKHRYVVPGFLEQWLDKQFEDDD